MRKLVFVLLMLPTMLEARMYQWTDSDTGTTQLSGKPPGWYRTQHPGPRIFVFENGRIIDDTGIKVSKEHQELLRQRAYDVAEEELQKLKDKAIAEMKKEKLAKEQQQTFDEVEEDQEIVEAPQVEEQVIGTFEEEVLSGENLSLEDMRQLIQSWEALQKQEAMKLIEQ